MLLQAKELVRKAGIIQERVFRTVEHGPPILNHIGMFDKVERPVNILFDQQHGDALIGYPA
jgi:hypothetical protein